jgi:hypothetical protein
MPPSLRSSAVVTSYDRLDCLRVEEATFDATLADVRARPEAFEPIRRAGFELVHARHSDVNRADALEHLIRERCAVPTV